ncbi:MAG: OmpH family outer membrane protein [Chitinophagaceae bacterium]|nr:OmpH family outer membrane protein [Chitinophagaceae bacterium]
MKTFACFVLPALFFFIAISCPAQKKQLSASDKVSIKIGLIDHSKLRNNYRAFVKAKENLALQNANNTKEYSTSLKQLETKTEKELKQDSIRGGNNREKINQDFLLQKTVLFNDYKAKQEQLNKQRIKIAEEHERKINIAISNVLSELGFTDIKPMTKDDKEQKGEDITDLILAQLNKN